MPDTMVGVVMVLLTESLFAFVTLFIDTIVESE